MRPSKKQLAGIVAATLVVVGLSRARSRGDSA
jgi:hypothetical protein